MLSKCTLLIISMAIAIGSGISCTNPSSRDQLKIGTKITKADTIFLRNITWNGSDDSSNTAWNKVYIEYNKESASRKQLLDFTIVDEYLANYKNKNLRHFDTSMFPDEWLPLYKYKEKYYLYSPGDSDSKFVLRDSIFIAYFHEPIYFGIDSFKQVNKAYFRLQTKADSLPSGFARPSYNIYLVDPVKGIAIWEDTSISEGDKYKLFVAKEKAYNFDIVINDASNRPEEFEFEPIDFNGILKSSGLKIFPD